MNNFYVYIYENEDGLPMYVGKGKEKRIKTHLTCKKHSPFHNKIRKMLKNGYKPLYYKYKEKLTEQQALNLEVCLIYSIGRKDKGLGPLLNLTDGGEGLSGHIFSKQHKEKLSNSAKKRKPIERTKQWNENISLSRQGKTIHTKESKEKLSKIGKTKTWVHKKTGELKRIDKNDLDTFLNNDWYYGKPQLPDVGKKVSEKLKGRKKGSFSDEHLEKLRKPKSVEHCEKISKDRKGRIYVNNGVKNKMIRKNDLEKFLKRGYVKGRIMSVKHKEKLSVKNTIWINNGEINKRITKYEQGKYLKQGFVTGKIKI